MRRHLDAVGDPRREAGGGRLVPRRQLPAARRLPDLRLGQTRVAQRRLRAPLGRGPDPWTEAGPGVVGVGAGSDGGDPMLGCEWREYVEQLRLAEVAAVPVVGPIAVSVHLVRRRRQLSYAETVGERGRRTPLGLRQRA